MNAPNTEQPFSPLVAQILTANASYAAQTSSALIDSLAAEVATLRAQRAAIREGVRQLLDGEYMPTPAAIIRRLYPTATTVDLYRDKTTD
ncbi:hypothetical protein AB0B94_30425 [Micromonospora sp. NPDC048986]|uniref:hypothetical protein n=1 Tax=Micromonospora sp. NPDC048986 TaxID=3155644 RepID=UPI0033E2DBE4